MDGWAINSGLCKVCVQRKQVYHDARQCGESGMMALLQDMMQQQLTTSESVEREVAEALEERAGPGG